jgi:hypothetical protein
MVDSPDCSTAEPDKRVAGGGCESSGEVVLQPIVRLTLRRMEVRNLFMLIFPGVSQWLAMGESSCFGPSVA